MEEIKNRTNHPQKEKGAEKEIVVNSFSEFTARINSLKPAAVNIETVLDNSDISFYTGRRYITSIKRAIVNKISFQNPNARGRISYYESYCDENGNEIRIEKMSPEEMIKYEDSCKLTALNRAIALESSCIVTYLDRNGIIYDQERMRTLREKLLKKGVHPQYVKAK